MDVKEYIPNRIASLRVEKNVSARDMSLSLGQSESYINKIENKHSLPSIENLSEICNYFGISLSDFFKDSVSSPRQINEIVDQLSKLPPDQTSHIQLLVNDLSRLPINEERN